MPVYQRLINFNEMFAKLKEVPIMINDLKNITLQDKEKIKNIITSRYSSDMISILPSCQCGKTKGEFAISSRCVECGTVVKSVIEDDIEPIVWFRRPREVAPLINPAIWILLSKRFTISGFNLLQWIADTSYRPNVKAPPILDKLVEVNLPRGYDAFVNNFDYIVSFLSTLKITKNKTKGKDYLMELIRQNRAAIFSDYIPLPNKILLVIEATVMSVYADNTVTKAIDALMLLAAIDSDELEHSNRKKENRTIKAIVKLAEFYENYQKQSISRKNGQFRKHILGSRTNFNFRTVISSLTGPHEYDEIQAPWCVGLTTFRHHLINKLLRRGFELNAAIELLLSHVEKYHPLLDELLCELIRETRNGAGIIVLENRNPTMLSGSMQTKRITKFKTNPKDHTTSTSILTTASMNADYDGDELNYSVSIDNFLADKWSTLEPHYNVFMATNPLEISDNIRIPKPVISSISNWIHGSSEIDPNMRLSMHQLLEDR